MTIGLRVFGRTRQLRVGRHRLCGGVAGGWRGEPVGCAGGVSAVAKCIGASGVPLRSLGEFEVQMEIVKFGGDG